MKRRVSSGIVSIVMLVLLVLLLIGGMVCGTLVGAVKLPMSAIWEALWHGETSLARGIVWDLRLPRILVGAMVGANLAVSGVLIQGITRNPLMAPSIIGISAGAGFAVVLMRTVFPGLSEVFLPLAAFAGSLGASLLVFSLAWKRGIAPIRLILGGVALTLFLAALTTGLLLSSGSETEAAEVYFWMAGGVLGRGWKHVQLLLPWSFCGLLLSFLFAGRLNLLLLDEDVIRGLGVRLQRWRLGLGGLALMLAASAVAVAGPIGFLGLIVPHMVRLVTGPTSVSLLFGAALLGSVLLVWSDIAARMLMAPAELPVGVLTTLIGGGFFLFLVRREGR